MNRDDFAVVIPAAPRVTLAAQETVEYYVVMRSATPGAKIATLVLGSATGVATEVDLVGTSLGNGDGDGDNAGPTYYTCHNCNSGGGAGVLSLLVFLGLRRRRRR